MNISQLFSRRKQQVFDSQRSVRQQYLESVKLLAAGSEIDEQSILSLIDELQITEQQLQADIEKQQQRNVATAEHELFKRATADVTRLTQESDKLAAERQAFLDRWQPKMSMVVTALRSAEQATNTYSQAERKLLDNVIDIELIDKQKSIESRRQQIGQQLYALQGDIEQANRRISHARSMVESAEATEILEGFQDWTTKVRQKNKERAIEQAQEKLTQAEKSASSIFNRRDRLKDQMAKIDVEQVELNKMKLLA